jgi:L-alanine-DL-glutamate epimerase-like enolase superfamily enzyme
MLSSGPFSIRSNGGTDALVREMRSYCDAGYNAVAKLKIGGAPLAEDRDRVEAVLSVLDNGQRLAVDDRDWLQFDCTLSYRVVEYLRTLRMLRDYGWGVDRCIPHGGHQLSLNLASGLHLGGNESYPDLFQPFSGFPDGVAVEDGYVTLPELPGIGLEGKADLMEVLADLSS